MVDFLVALAVLAPLAGLFVLTAAVTIHFFWLSRHRRWPPDLAPAGSPPRSSRGAPVPRPAGRLAAR